MSTNIAERDKEQAQTTEIATVRQPTSVAVGDRGFQLTTRDEVRRFAQDVCDSGLAPKGLVTELKPGMNQEQVDVAYRKNIASIMIALQMGAELGLTPMASLQNVAVINGRPSIWGDAMLAVCRASGIFDESAFKEEWSGSGDDYKCEVTVRRLPAGNPVVRTFSVKDAKKAGLWGKQGPWSSYPQRMLQMRARSFALRDCFGDILRGFQVAEEAQDIPAAHTAIPEATRPTNLQELQEAADATPVAEAATEAAHHLAREALAKCESAAEVSGVWEAHKRAFQDCEQEWTDECAEKSNSLPAARSSKKGKKGDGQLFETESGNAAAEV
ncbi:MAG TPA: hypothetical protein DCE55_29295 [Planctomycetaceae bacterium]|nr:hypothetical protein [Planctomycetaceae bacterium]|tara:strand:- start:12372 stop:13355 length:984 start_codon:yes stop_codon:yes gene_type:complete